MSMNGKLNTKGFGIGHEGTIHRNLKIFKAIGSTKIERDSKIHDGVAQIGWI